LPTFKRKGDEILKSSSIIAVFMGVMLFTAGSFMFLLSADKMTINFYELTFDARNVNTAMFMFGILFIISSTFIIIFGNRIFEEPLDESVVKE